MSYFLTLLLYLFTYSMSIFAFTYEFALKYLTSIHMPSGKRKNPVLIYHTCCFLLIPLLSQVVIHISSFANVYSLDWKIHCNKKRQKTVEVWTTILPGKQKSWEESRDTIDFLGEKVHYRRAFFWLTFDYGISDTFYKKIGHFVAYKKYTNYSLY